MTEQAEVSHQMRLELSNLCLFMWKSSCCLPEAASLSLFPANWNADAKTRLRLQADGCDHVKQTAGFCVDLMLNILVMLMLHTRRKMTQLIDTTVFIFTCFLYRSVHTTVNCELTSVTPRCYCSLSRPMLHNDHAEAGKLLIKGHQGSKYEWFPLRGGLKPQSSSVF